MALYTAPTFVNEQAPPLNATNLNALAQCAEDSQTLVFQNVTVQTSAFVSDSTFDGYSYRAAIPLSGVDTTYTPTVTFGAADAASGIYLNIASTYSGGVFIYANAQPSAAITILNISCAKGANL